jgi:hypothetical protein
VGEFGVIAEKTTPALRQRGVIRGTVGYTSPPLLPEMSHLPLLSRPPFPSPYQLYWIAFGGLGFFHLSGF